MARGEGGKDVSERLKERRRGGGSAAVGVGQIEFLPDYNRHPDQPHTRMHEYGGAK